MTVKRVTIILVCVLVAAVAVALIFGSETTEVPLLPTLPKNGGMKSRMEMLFLPHITAETLLLKYLPK